MSLIKIEILKIAVIVRVSGIFASNYCGKCHSFRNLEVKFVGNNKHFRKVIGGMLAITETVVPKSRLL